MGHIHGGERRLGSFAEIEKDGGGDPELFTFVDKVCKKSLNSMQKLFDQLDNHLIKNQV